MTETTSASLASGTVLVFKAQKKGTRTRRGARPRYYYPREALEQPFFTVTGRGEKLPSGLHLSMLASGEFKSQIELLLSQLSNEGFDVSGPEAEFRAMREIIQRFDYELSELISGAHKIRNEFTEASM